MSNDLPLSNQAKVEQNTSKALPPVITENSYDNDYLIDPSILTKWEELNSIVDNTNQKFDKILTLHENDFLKAFKLQMFRLSEQLETLKAKVDDKLLAQKRDKKIMTLQQQLDYFRNQAVWMEKEREGYIVEIKKLKQKVDALKDDKLYFESFVINARKENNSLQERIRMLEEHGNKQIVKIVEEKFRVEKNSSSEARLYQTEPKVLKEIKPWSVNKEYKPKMGSLGKNQKMVLGKYRKENEVFTIMENCIKEVQRDIWLKESKRTGKVYYTPGQLEKDRELIDMIQYDDFEMQDKYNMIQQFLSHQVVLNKLKQLLDDDRSTKDGESKIEGYKSNHSLKQEVRIRKMRSRANLQSAGVTNRRKKSKTNF